ncbi:F0F1 ATP synthase subunit delta [Sulfurovum mangrovi]|uniref:F0F1 ATP synthase subunit delta n=1 Tax=Sulfurovum mangrovi TaxID=2893889 RepID=UPI001E37BD45|nr:F0F1 ATP synthase subunit delta [Sulfurovum mangrovi]UFH58683.1 F0F1 ATP synthase subunit delta [Sulfurovum mangrovi]
MEELIARRYAQALTAVSKDVAADAALLSTLSEAINNKEVMTALTSPIITSEKKTDMVLNAVGENANTAMKNFIKILGENKRLDLIPVVSKVLNKELQKESNQYEGVVKSANPLDAAALADLEETLQKYTGATVKLAQEKSDLDGIRVAVDDLGIEVNFSKQRVKEQLIDFIKKSL